MESDEAVITLFQEEKRRGIREWLTQGELQMPILLVVIQKHVVVDRLNLVDRDNPLDAREWNSQTQCSSAEEKDPVGHQLVEPSFFQAEGCSEAP